MNIAYLEEFDKELELILNLMDIFQQRHKPIDVFGKLTHNSTTNIFTLYVSGIVSLFGCFKCLPISE